MLYWFSPPPPFYGLPKVHKDNIPLRPIIDYSRSPLYGLARFVSSLLKPFTLNSVYSLNSAYKFINDLKEVKAPSSFVMASLDVVSLFTSIPIDYACFIIRDLNPQFTEFPDLDLDTFMKLVTFCLSQNCFCYDNTFYKQINGTPMGSPLSVSVAEITMQYIENKILNSSDNKILFYLRYVDDVYLIAENHELNEILCTFNSVCPSIQFTIEKEIDCKLPFLDILIERRVNNNFLEFHTSVYRKNTFTSQYLNFNSCNPNSHKIAVFRTLVYRAYRYCSNNSLFDAELNRIFSDLKLNDYPLRWLKRIYRENIYPSLTKFNKPSPPPPTLQYSSPMKIKNLRIPVPYYRNISEAISKLFIPYGILISHKPQFKISNLLSNSKQKFPSLDLTGIIYSIPCMDCNAAYIGETGRTGNIRLKEHKRLYEKGDLKSKLVSHSLETDHKPNFNNIKILVKNCNNYYSRIFLEGWFTKLQPNPLNEACAIATQYSILLSNDNQ